MAGTTASRPVGSRQSRRNLIKSCAKHPAAVDRGSDQLGSSTCRSPWVWARALFCPGHSLGRLEPYRWGRSFLQLRREGECRGKAYPGAGAEFIAFGAPGLDGPQHALGSLFRSARLGGADEYGVICGRVSKRSISIIPPEPSRHRRQFPSERLQPRRSP
jgi:hypothetical protein